MNDSAIVSQKQQLEYLFNDISIGDDNLEMSSHWARYLCVRTSGFIENSISFYFSEFARAKSHPYIANHITTKLKKFQNPNMDKILTLAGSFNVSWRDQLEQYVENEGRKEAIDSIVSLRNKIAHGESVGITLNRARDYYKKTTEVVAYIKRLTNT